MYFTMEVNTPTEFAVSESMKRLVSFPGSTPQPFSAHHEKKYGQPKNTIRLYRIKSKVWIVSDRVLQLIRTMMLLLQATEAGV